MTLKQTLQTLQTLTLLNECKIHPKYYKQVERIMLQEATTHNIKEASELLSTIESNLNNYETKCMYHTKDS